MTIPTIGQIKSKPIQQLGKTYETTEECFGDEFPVFVHYNVWPGSKGLRNEYGVPMEPDEDASIEIVVVYLVFGEELCEVYPTDDWLRDMRVTILESLDGD